VASKEKGLGVLFWQDRKVESHLNLIGVFHIKKVSVTTDNDEANKDDEAGISLTSNDIDFKNLFTLENLKIKNDPIINQVGIIPSKNNKIRVSQSSKDFKVKPLFLKLKKQNIDEKYLSQQLLVSTSEDSKVELIDGAGVMSISLRQLVEDGVYIGFNPKKGVKLTPADVTPLNVKLKISLDGAQFSSEHSWSSFDNQVIYEFTHYLTRTTGTSFDNINKLSIEYNKIPWKN